MGATRPYVAMLIGFALCLASCETSTQPNTGTSNSVAVGWKFISATVDSSLGDIRDSILVRTDRDTSTVVAIYPSYLGKSDVIRFDDQLYAESNGLLYFGFNSSSSAGDTLFEWSETPLPLIPGQSTSISTDTTIFEMHRITSLEFKCLDYQPVTVPAGTFYCLRITMSLTGEEEGDFSPRTISNSTGTAYYSRDLRTFVRTETIRTESRPGTGDSSWSHSVEELERIVKP